MGIKFIMDRNEEEKIKVITIPIVLKKPSLKNKKPDDKEFVLDWENALGYKENPYKNKIIAPVSKYIADFELEKEKLNLFIISNKKFGTIIGENGSGKTILLKWLEEQLQKFKSRIVIRYIDWPEVKINIRFVKELFKPSSGFGAFSEKELNDIDADNFEVKLKKELGNKKYVLLIDNMQKFTKERFLPLDKLLAMNTQIIVAGGKDLTSSLDSLKYWLDGRSIKVPDELNINLEGISLKGAIDMVAKRIAKSGGKGIHPFDEELLKKIWLKSRRNPARMIELCHDYAIELSVKKTEGLEIEDVRSYQKDGVKLERSAPEEAFFSESKEDATRGKDYKIRVVDKSKGVVIQEEKGMDTKKYVIKGKRR